VRGQAAVAKFRLGLDVDVDGGNRQSVFVKGLPGGRRVIDFIGVDDFHTVIAVDIGHEGELLIQRQRGVVFVEPVLGFGQKTGNDGHFEHDGTSRTVADRRLFFGC
jgi:hypothetical protein